MQMALWMEHNFPLGFTQLSGGCIKYNIYPKSINMHDKYNMTMRFI